MFDAVTQAWPAMKNGLHSSGAPNAYCRAPCPPKTRFVVGEVQISVHDEGSHLHEVRSAVGGRALEADVKEQEQEKGNEHDAYGIEVRGTSHEPATHNGGNASRDSSGDEHEQEYGHEPDGKNGRCVPVEPEQ